MNKMVLVGALIASFFLIASAEAAAGDDHDPSFNLDGMKISNSVLELLPFERRSKAVSCEAENELGYSQVCMRLFGSISNARSKRMACCNGRCVNAEIDNFHCGFCNRGCEGGFSCCHGRCVDLKNDRRNCGECRLRCPIGVTCSFGICGYSS